MLKIDVDYGYYYNTYNNGYAGVIPSDSFGMYAAKARYQIEAMLTSDQAEAHTEIIRLCICEVADKLYEDAKKQGIKSENIDGYSVTYADSANAKKDVKNIIIRWLGDTGLLYTGVERC